MDGATAYSWASDWLRNIGVPDHLATRLLDTIPQPHFEAIEQQREDALMADLTPEAHRMIARADREKAQGEVARFERMMREQPQEYWKPENQDAYRAALEASLVEAPVLPPVSLPSMAPPSPAPPTVPVAPGRAVSGDAFVGSSASRAGWLCHGGSQRRGAERDGRAGPGIGV